MPDTVNAIIGITNGNDLNNNGRFTEIDPNDLTDNTRIRFTPQNEFLLRVVDIADELNAADANDYTVEFPLELPELRSGITEFDVRIPFPSETATSETATVVRELPERLTLELSVPPLLTVERGLSATVLVVDTTPVEAGIRQPELTGMTHTITVREGTGLTLTIEINTSLGFNDLQVDYEVLPLPYDGIGKQAEVEDLLGQQVIKDTAVIQKGETTTEIRIDTLDDNIAEYYEYLLVRLTDARAVDVREQARVVTEQSEVILRIRDNEPVEYRFRGATQTIESDGIYEPTLERRGAVPFSAVAHTYTVVGSDGPGRQPAEARDFKNGIPRQEILLEGLFEFDPFENEDSITIGLEDDRTPEPPKQFTVRAAGQELPVLLDDNDALVDALFSDLQPLTLAENQTIAVPFSFNMLFLRERNEPGDSDDIRVDFRIVPESAENSDYELPLTSVIVPADKTTGTVELRIPDDSIYEGEETFRLEITEVQLLSDDTRIYNEAERIARGLLVTIQVDPADLPQFETQPLNGGIQNEGTTYTLQVELVNADADGSPTDLTLEFQQSAASTASTTTDYQIQPLTIDALQSAATVEIRLIDDTLYEPTETVELSIVAYSVDGGPSQVHAPTVTHQFEIADQDSPVIRLRTVDSSNRVNEMDGQVTLLIVLDNAPTTGSPEDLDIVIDIARSSVATATMGVDYNLLATMARIGRGESQAEIVLELLDDDIYETTENLGLYPANIAINGRNYPAIATADNTSVITIEDDDKLIASLEAIDTGFAESGYGDGQSSVEPTLPGRHASRI